MSIINEGPDYTEIINEKFPEVKLVVFDSFDSNLESLYRKNKIFYYAIHPVGINEIADLLYSAFYLSENKDIVESNKLTYLPQVISRLNITNRHSKNVTLVTFDNIIMSDKGIGYLLHKSLLDKGYPLEVDHVWAINPITEWIREQKISQILEKQDRVIILQSENMNKIPGSIVIDSHAYDSNISPDKSIITITIQPGRSDSNDMCFDMVTTKSLAEIIEFEMTKPSK